MSLAFIVGNYGISSSSFIMLIIIDLATKWLLLRYKCLIDSVHVKQIQVFMMIA